MRLLILRGASPFLLMLVLGCGAALAADPFDIWHWRNPEPTGSRLKDVAYGAGRYVAVGENGDVLVSNDSKNWNAARAPLVSTLRGIAYGAGQFVAVGESGTVVSSEDGTTWKKETTGTLVRLNDICWSGAIFTAVGNDGTIMTSPEGSTWTLRSTGGDDIQAVDSGDGRVIAVGGYPSNGGSTTNPDPPRPLVLVSTTGVNWTSHRPPAIHSLTGVVYGNGRWVAAAEDGDS